MTTNYLSPLIMYKKTYRTALHKDTRKEHHIVAGDAVDPSPNASGGERADAPPTQPFIDGRNGQNGSSYDGCEGKVGYDGYDDYDDYDNYGDFTFRGGKGGGIVRYKGKGSVYSSKHTRVIEARRRWSITASKGEKK